MRATAQTESYFLARGQAQYDYRCDLEDGHSIFRAGWGSGKTYVSADKACARAQLNQGNGILLAQHYRHLRHVMVPALMERAEANRLAPRWLTTDKVLLFQALPRANQFGCQFAYGLSADAPDSIRAVQGTWLWGDEPAAYSMSRTDAMRDAFLQASGRVRGRDVAPGRDWSGTNEGEGTRFYELQTDDERIASGEVRVHTGSTVDNLAYVGQAFIDEVSSSLPDELLGQYLHGGVGQLAAEMACWEWSDDFIEPCTVSTAHPLITAWDFGIAPMAMSVCQRVGDNEDSPINWLGEVVIPLRGNTEDACLRFCEQWKPRHPGPIVIKGDASGASGSAQSRSQNYEQIISIMSRYWSPELIWYSVPAANPPILARLIRANSAIKRGLVRVDPSCVNMIRDCRGTRLEQGASGPKENQKDGHSHSWVGMCYTLHDYCPIVSRPPVAGGAQGPRESFRKGSPVDPAGYIGGRLKP